MTSTKTPQLTLVYLLRPDLICLAMKKRGFGAGKWNGCGGKVEAGETIQEAACREVAEEIVVTVDPSALESVAVIDFIFADGTQLEVHAFFVRQWQGEPAETEEMRPEWFPYEQIPYQSMRSDDIHWLPRALAGECLRGRVEFAANGEEIVAMEWNEVSSL